MKKILKNKNAELRILNLENLIKNAVINDVVLAYKTAFFRLTMVTKYEKTRATLEKFYYNSGLTNLKTLWLFKTLHEKETKKIPKEEFLLGNLINQKKIYEKKNRKNFIIEKLKNIIKAVKTRSTKHLLTLARDFKNEKEKKIKICKIFGNVEKIAFNRKENIFKIIKKFAVEDFSKKKQGITLLEKIYEKNIKKSRKQGLIGLKAILQDKKKIENGLKKLLGITKKINKKNFKKCYYKIFVYSLERYKHNIKKSNNFYVGLKKLESFFTLKKLKVNSNVMSTIKNDFYETKKKINFFNKLKKNNLLLKKEYLLKLKNHSKKVSEVYNNYLLKWKISSKEAENYIKNIKHDKDTYLSSVKLLNLFLEKQMKVKKQNHLKNSFSKILTASRNISKQDIIKNTLILSNFMNLLLKRDKMKKLEGLYAWRENCKEIGSYEYKKVLNKNGVSEVQFVYYLKGFERNKRNWIIGLLMLKNILGKIRVRNNGVGFRSLFFYCFKNEVLDVLKIFAFFFKEKSLEHKMFFFRRFKYHFLENRKVSDGRFVERKMKKIGYKNSRSYKYSKNTRY